MKYIYSNINNTISGSIRSNKLKKIKTKKTFKNIAILLIIFITISIFMNISLGREKLTTKTVTVDSGSTLWDIANEICTDNSNLNVQNVIIQIKKLNNLQSSIIYEGQKLLIYEY